MSDKKCKWTAPNGQEYECIPSLICGDCENNNINYWCSKKDGYCSKRNCFSCEFLDKVASAEAIEKATKINRIEELKNAYEAGKMLQYQKENGEWVDFSKNTVCDDFKFQEHLNYRIKPAYDHKSLSDKKTDGKTWISDSMCTEVHLTRRKPCEYIKGVLSAFGAEHLIDLPESMRLLVLQSLEEIIVNE